MASKSSGKRAKLVRDSFTIPKAEFAAIDSLKLRAITQGIAVKKSELLRAGLMVLVGLDDSSFKAALTAVPTLKTGRPSAEEPVTVAAKAPAAPQAVKPVAKAATPKPAAKPSTKATPVRSAQKAAAPATSRTRAASAKPVKPAVAKTAPRAKAAAAPATAKTAAAAS